jgi:hypothetical protein
VHCWSIWPIRQTESRVNSNIATQVERPERGEDYVVELQNNAEAELSGCFEDLWLPLLNVQPWL